MIYVWHTNNTACTRCITYFVGGRHCFHLFYHSFATRNAVFDFAQVKVFLRKGQDTSTSTNHKKSTSTKRTLNASAMGPQRFGLVALAYALVLLTSVVARTSSDSTSQGCIARFLGDGDCDLQNNNEECGRWGGGVEVSRIH